jgi:hypothetical protein
VSGANSTAPQGGPGAASAASGLFLRRADGKQKGERDHCDPFRAFPCDALYLPVPPVMMCVLQPIVGKKRKAMG